MYLLFQTHKAQIRLKLIRLDMSWLDCKVLKFGLVKFNLD